MLETGSEHIDLVFCDLQMPLMDGVECVRNQLGPGINKVVDKLVFCVVGCIGFYNSSELELELKLGSPFQARPIGLNLPQRNNIDTGTNDNITDEYGRRCTYAVG